jgi:hypothetical protein
MNIDIIDHNCNLETGLWFDEGAILSSVNDIGTGSVLLGNPTLNDK